MITRTPPYFAYFVFTYAATLYLRMTHALYLRIMTEKIRRDTWMQEKSREIKEMTVKGLQVLSLLALLGEKYKC